MTTVQRCCLGLALAAAMGPAQPAPAVRNKIAAGDLRSAEAILENYRLAKGEDKDYILGLAWLCRGAALTGDWAAAARYGGQIRQRSAKQLASPADWEPQREMVYALGTAIEVEAQSLAAKGHAKAARELVQRELQTYASAPVAFRSRLYKRLNLMTMVGQPAPELAAEDSLGAKPPPLSSLKGKPVALFFWANWCGDCKAQAAALARVVERYAPRGVVFLAPTRYYETDHAKEKTEIAKVWAESYAGLAATGVPISQSAMLRWGAASTPTFALVDRAGVVRLYSPTMLTEERLSAEIEKLLR